MCLALEKLGVLKHNKYFPSGDEGYDLSGGGMLKIHSHGIDLGKDAVQLQSCSNSTHAW